VITPSNKVPADNNRLAGCDRCSVVGKTSCFTNYDGGISAVGKIPIRCIIGVAERWGFNIPDKIGADNHAGKTWVTGIDGEAGAFRSKMFENRHSGPPYQSLLKWVDDGFLKTKKAGPS
jgi:hypothetical protein